MVIRPRGLPRPVGAALGVLADRMLGEPPATHHPVVGFGHVMHDVERSLYRDTRVAGVTHVALGVALGAGAGWVLGSTTAATALAVAGRALERAALDVHDALAQGDLGRARELVQALVGRDPSELDEKDIVRAVVESIAENTVDAVVAPALFGALAGAPGALGYRAINTLDAMVGYRSPRYRRYGWASARLDDVANFVPARVTALLVVAARPGLAREVRRAWHEDAPAHPSPNAGVAEAAFAAALGISLGGTNRYDERVEVRPTLGRGRVPELGDIARAAELARAVSGLLVLGLGAAGVLSRWRERSR